MTQDNLYSEISKVLINLDLCDDCKARLILKIKKFIEKK